MGPLKLEREDWMAAPRESEEVNGLCRCEGTSDVKSGCEGKEERCEREAGRCCAGCSKERALEGWPGEFGCWIDDCVTSALEVAAVAAPAVVWSMQVAADVESKRSTGG